MLRLRRGDFQRLPDDRVLGGAGFPFRLLLDEFRLFIRFHGRTQFLQLLRVLLSLGSQLYRRLRRGSLNILLIYAIEEGIHLIILPLGNRVVFVRVALGAAERKAEPDRADGIGPVDRLLHSVLLGVRTPFRVMQRVPMKAAGNLLLLCGLRQQIAGNLFGGELVERLIGVQGCDDPVAIPPGERALAVFLVTVAIRVAGLVQPMPPPPFAVMGRCQQAVDEPFVGVGPRVGRELADFIRRGKQPD